MRASATAYNRPDARYAWRGPSTLMVDDEGRSGTDEFQGYWYWYAALYGNAHGAKAALSYLEKTDGALICVWSALSDRGAPLQGAYGAAKHALKGWLDALRVELMHEGSKVRVTLVKPSSVDTPHNLFIHVEGDCGPTGDFTQKAKKRSLYREIAATYKE